MSLPDGVTTCLLTYGPITDTFGNLAESITVEVIADRTIVHEATGRTMFDVPISVTADAGGVVQIPLPHTNQAGFLDKQQNALTGWYYTITLTARFASGPKTDRKVFQPLVGQVTRDADLLPSDGMVTPGVTVPQTSVTSVNGQTGAVDLTATFVSVNEDGEPVVDGVVQDFGGGGDPVEAAGTTVLGYGFGLGADGPRPAVERAPTIGPNLWQTQYFSAFAQEIGTGGSVNTSTLTPTVTADGSNHNVHTRIDIRTIRKDTSSLRFRISLDISATTMVIGGFQDSDVSFSVLKPDGTPNTWWDFRRVVQSSAMRIVAPSPDTLPLNAHRFMFEIDASGQDVGNRAYLDINIRVPAAASSGTVGITNASVYEVPATTPMLRVGWDRTPGVNAGVKIQMPGFDHAGIPRYISYLFGPDNQLALSPIECLVQYDAALGAVNRFQFGNTGTNYRASQFTTNNCDFIHFPVRADGELDVTGNTHGGEVGLTGTYGTDWKMYADFGNGWQQITTYDAYAYYAFKVKIVTQSKLTRTDQPGSPYAEVQRSYYIYPDGTVRKDFSVTFIKAQAIANLLWDMESFAPGGNTPTNVANAYRARLGRGASVIADSDTSTRLTAPVTTAPATATTGGAIAGGLTYGIYVTALSVSGETTPGLTFTTIGIPATTNTNTATANWGAVAGATGYAVYFGFPGYEKRVAVLGPGATTYTVLGTEPLAGPLVPATNDAVVQSGNDHIAVHDADWAAYFDPFSGAVHGMALDHTAISQQTGIQGIYARQFRVDGGYLKTYWPVEFEQNSIEPYVVPNGTVYSGTSWRFTYFPRDRDAWEGEIALRGAAVQHLASVYPTTA